MSDCVNLRQQFGSRYVIRYEESRQGRERDPWLEIIPCKLGHLFPFGGTKLAASIDGYPRLARRVASLPGCRVHQDGDDGTTIVFDVADFDAVAKIMRPKQRRRLSDVAKAELSVRLAENRPSRPTKTALPKAKPAFQIAA